MQSDKGRNKMEINKIQNNNYNNSFKAKVSQRFVNSMRGFINNGPNRLKNNHRLSKKLEDYATKYGYEDYTVHMQQSQGPLGSEYRLIAVKDGDDISNGIVLTKNPYTSYRKIFLRFMELSSYDFNNIMRKYLK